jgi:aromatic-L-amino-acid decarboxylase
MALALEAGVLRWLVELFGFASTGQAVLLSGGSMANLTALAAARERDAPGAPHRATIYVGAHAHASVRKAARTLGILPEHVRVCGTSDGLHRDVRVGAPFDQARLRGRPAAGRDRRGCRDDERGRGGPLPQLADLAEEVRTWLHVDGAYGGFFQFTQWGQACLGIKRADSITPAQVAVRTLRHRRADRP